MTGPAPKYRNGLGNGLPKCLSHNKYHFESNGALYIYLAINREANIASCLFFFGFFAVRVAILAIAIYLVLPLSVCAVCSQ